MYLLDRLFLPTEINLFNIPGVEQSSVTAFQLLVSCRSYLNFSLGQKRIAILPKLANIISI
jgi:hypothetical protein